MDSNLNITNYFNSQEFYDLVKDFKHLIIDLNSPLNSIEFLVSAGIKYAILTGNEGNYNVNGLTDFLYQVCQEVERISQNGKCYSFTDYELRKFVAKRLSDKVLEKFEMTQADLSDESKKRMVFKDILKNSAGNLRKYHAFNSAFLDSIKKYGLDPNRKTTKQEEIDHINEIFERYGIKTIFGWQKVNCDKKVFYSETPDVSYYYGIYSPEWFGQFTGQSFEYPLIQSYEKDAFPLKNYDAASNNLMTLMTKSHFSQADINSVMTFFNQEWRKYANTKPLLLIIPGEDIELRTNALLEAWSDEKDIADFLYLCTYNNGIDIGSKEIIDTSNATYIELPEYDKILRYAKTPSIFEPEDETTYSSTTFDDMFQKLTTCRVITHHLSGEEEKYTYTSDYPEELSFFLKTIEDEKFFKSAIKYLGKTSLTTFLEGYGKYFHPDIIRKEENLKKIALFAPTCFNWIPSSIKENEELMLKCANQTGINPHFLYYMPKKARNDFIFISTIIVNSTEKTFDFYGESISNLTGSAMRYGTEIGADVQKNPIFWDLLNQKIRDINQKNGKNYPYFDKEVELEIATNHFDRQSENNLKK